MGGYRAYGQLTASGLTQAVPPSSGHSAAQRTHEAVGPQSAWHTSSVRHAKHENPKTQMLALPVVLSQMPTIPALVAQATSALPPQLSSWAPAGHPVPASWTRHRFFSFFP